jgi:hypothetical protein
MQPTLVTQRPAALAALAGLLLAGPAVAAVPEVQVLASRPSPIDAYLMPDEASEVALARSAAPPSVAANASVWVLGSTGYREVEAGSNGFACLVGRAWSAPIRFASGRLNPEFWSLEVKAPICLNPEAVRTILPVLVRRTELTLAGASLEEVERDAMQRYADGTFRPPHGVAMGYMLSKQQNLGLGVGHYMPHVMLYAPHADNEDWGGGNVLTGWPFVGENEGNPHSLVIIPLGRWSDGTPAEMFHAGP